MTVERIVRIIAGFFILLSLVLAHFAGTVDMSQLSWLWFTAFVGANLFQSVHPLLPARHHAEEGRRQGRQRPLSEAG